MRYTDFGHKFARPSGIGLLMDDLAHLVASGKDMLMLGGGNPGLVPEAAARYRELFREAASTEAGFHKATGSYGSAQGQHEFTESIAQLLKQEYGWPITARNIALTNGSQNAFFLLFNLFGGKNSQLPSGRISKILLPLTPEYIGYEDVSVGENFFVSNRPLIDIIDKRTFKYRVDFNSLPNDPDINAICVSRPTNPTGNVLTNDELAQLDAIAQQRGIPLIVDNAYGEPFPNLIHTDVSLNWHENIILCMSLSKLGLPALRTGIVIASEPVAKLLGKMNSIINLTPVSFGPAVLQPLFESGEIISLSRDYLKPFYAAKVEKARRWFDEAMGDLVAYAHKPEGAIFLWLWFPDLPITSQQLYERLKVRGVLVVPGHYFFPGLDAGTDQEDLNWKHQHECIRISYAMDDHIVQKGIEIIGEEVKKAYKNK